MPVTNIPPACRMWRRLWLARLWLVVGPVSAYQRVMAPVLPRGRCRFEPSCSQYMIESVLCHGLFKGVIAGCSRVMRCNPFGGSGFDPAQDFAWWWESEKRRKLRDERHARGEAIDP